jgi:integrase
VTKPRRTASGTWRVQWFDHAGKRRSATFATEGAAKVALRRALSERDDVRSGRITPKAVTTVREAAAQWLPTRPPGRRADNERHLRVHILPALGDVTLAKVDARKVQQFTRHLENLKTARKGERVGKPLAPSSIANVLTTLRKLLRDCGHHVAMSYKVPTSDYGWIRTPEEVARFLDACEPPWFRVACALALHAGLRKGEIGGLRVDAVNLRERYIRIDRSYSATTKGKRVRYVPLSQQLAAIIAPWITSYPHNLVISVGGEPLTRHGLDLAKRCARACKRAKIPRVTFHQLRHTYASHLAQRVSLPVVGAMLGHQDPKTTARYAHLDTESLARDERLHLTYAAEATKVLPPKDEP